MVKPRRDREQERRIALEIVVDAFDTHERAMGWYYYLEEQLKFPFTATCTAKRVISPLLVKDEVRVVGMPGEDECEHEMFVTIRWERYRLAVPLAQLRPVSATDKRTKQGVEDWNYWVKMGYEL